MSKKLIQEKVDWVFNNYDIWAWEDFTNYGNLPEGYIDTPNYGENYGTVWSLIIKNSPYHLEFGKRIRYKLGTKRISYDFLLKLVTRIISIECTVKDMEEMKERSIMYRKTLQQKQVI